MKNNTIMQDLRYWSLPEGKPQVIKEMTGNNIFVFGSNPEGRHGAGAALAALSFGAKYGIGRGKVGNTYALVTKNLTKGYIEHHKEGPIHYHLYGEKSITNDQLLFNIRELYQDARDNPHLTYYISYVHTGKVSLNGYHPLFLFRLMVEYQDVPCNIRFHTSYKGLAL